MRIGAGGLGHGEWGAGVIWAKYPAQKNRCHTNTLLCYNITHPIFKDWYIDVTH
jgi:hypothetical protein